MRLWALAATVGLLAAPTATAQAPTARSVAGAPPELTAGRGASVPFVEHEAEDGLTDGEIIGPGRRFGSLPAEASGRRSVRLTPGRSAGFVLDAPADALTVRYAVPDAADCRAGDARLAVRVDGRPAGTLALTPCFSWYYGEYPFTHEVDGQGAHHAFDHARLRLEQIAPAGARVELTLEEGGAPWAVIDVADFERVGAEPIVPPGALSVLDFGADPTGVQPSLDAIQAAIDAGRRSRRPVWLAPGEYRVDGHLIVDRVELVGAGPWRSVLRGDGVGVYGRHARDGGSRSVTLRDFAIIGEVTRREDHVQTNGVGGALSDSLVENLFIQHTKVGVWLDGPMDRITLRRLVILDQAADGLNLHGGVTNALVEDVFVRNVGDDGLAMWSHPTPNAGVIFRRNTVIAPALANGVAVYGGRDIGVFDNVVADTLTRGGGVHLGARFDATPFEGEITLRGNTVLRGGSIDPVWKFGVGAVWLYALDRPIDQAVIRLSDTTVIDSTDAALQVLGPQLIAGVSVEGLTVRGAASVIQIRAPGEAVLRNVAAEDLSGSAIDDHAPAFTLIDGGGARGWRPQARPGHKP